MVAAKVLKTFGLNPSGFESQYHHQFMNHSITNQPIFKPETNREVHMEDVTRMKLALMKEMACSNISMDIENENKFYNSLSFFLEESFNWPDYKRFN